jgi:hypothetical protein
VNARHVLLPLCVLCTVTAARADDVVEKERGLVVDVPGPQKLLVDLDLLAGAAPGRSFADLRIVDGAGRDVPYLIVPPEPPGDKWIDAVRIVPTARTKDTSGFEIDLGTPTLVDRLSLAELPAPFIKRLKLEAAADHAHYNLLAEDQTVFHLPEQGLSRLDVDFAPGQYRYLRGTWDDRTASPMPLVAKARARSCAGPAPTLALIEAIAFERETSNARTSRFRIVLPAKGLPLVALDLEPREGELHRQATVSEPRLAGQALEPFVLGTTMLRRTSQGGLLASQVRVSVARPQTGELWLKVDDGDNPPLELAAVRAVFAPEPFIFFDGKAQGPLTARLGNPKASAPKYDLEAIRHALPKDLHAARWQGPSRPSGPAKAAPPIASAVLGGAAVDAAGFGYARGIAPGPGGLVSVRLDAAVLAHSRELADVRIADARGRQVPYIVERETDPLLIPLSPERIDAPAGVPAKRSCLRIRLPYATLPAARLSLTTPARVFVRSVALWVDEADGKRDPKGSRMRMVSERSWTHGDRDAEAPPMELDLPGAAEVIVAIDDGDNSALPIGAVELVTSAYRLRFFRDEGGSVRLLYGHPDLSVPRYDLTLLAPELEGAKAAAAELLPEQILPQKPAGPDRESRWFWAALVGAVVVLLAIIARLVRKAEPAS